jgi:hypothetical protein
VELAHQLDDFFLTRGMLAEIFDNLCVDILNRALLQSLAGRVFRSGSKLPRLRPRVGGADFGCPAPPGCPGAATPSESK